MFFTDLLKLSYLKEEAATEDEIALLPAGAKVGMDYHLVVKRADFEQVMVNHRANEPMSEAILMAIGKANGKPDPIWNTLAQNPEVIEYYTKLCSERYSAQLEELEKQNPQFTPPSYAAYQSRATGEDGGPTGSAARFVASMNSGFVPPATIEADVAEEAKEEAAEVTSQQEAAPVVEQPAIQEEPQVPVASGGFEFESVGAPDSNFAPSGQDAPVIQEPDFGYQVPTEESPVEATQESSGFVPPVTNEPEEATPIMAPSPMDTPAFLQGEEGGEGTPETLPMAEAPFGFVPPSVPEEEPSFVPPSVPEEEPSFVPPSEEAEGEEPSGLAALIGEQTDATTGAAAITLPSAEMFGDMGAPTPDMPASEFVPPSAGSAEENAEGEENPRSLMDAFRDGSFSSQQPSLESEQPASSKESESNQGTVDATLEEKRVVFTERAVASFADARTTFADFGFCRICKVAGKNPDGVMSDIIEGVPEAEEIWFDESIETTAQADAAAMEVLLALEEAVTTYISKNEFEIADKLMSAIDSILYEE